METLAFYFFPFSLKYFIFVGPAILLAMWAQMKVKSAYAHAGRVPAERAERSGNGPAHPQRLWHHRRGDRAC